MADLKIDKIQSSRWQKLAALDSDNFEEEVKGDDQRAYDICRSPPKGRGDQAGEGAPRRGCRARFTVDDLVALAASGKRFSVIYADPPWPWETWGGDSGKIHSAVDNHYGTSPLEEIMKLPVAALAADDCALLLWCTGPHITIGTHVEVIKSWGSSRARWCSFG